MSILSSFIGRTDGDANMSFIDHIEALRWHLIRSLLAIITASVVVFFNIEWIFTNVLLGPASSDFISYRLFCKVGTALHISALCLGDTNVTFQNTELSGQFMMSFSVSFMLGFIIAFPYVFYELWKFLKPALRPDEIKQARGIVFWTSLLFFIGVLFAYFLIIPYTINFFANYQLSPQFKNIITISNYYDTLTDLIMGTGLVFELPIAVFFLSKVGVLSPAVMRGNRRYAVLIILVVASVITPPDWLSMWLVAAPLLGLYEISIRLSARVHKAKARSGVV